MKIEKTHTPLPWRGAANDDSLRIVIIPDNQHFNAQRPIAEFRGSDKLSNAHFTLRAVNSYYDLIEALDDLVKACSSDSPSGIKVPDRETVRIAKLAIAKAARSAPQG